MDKQSNLTLNLAKSIFLSLFLMRDLSSLGQRFVLLYEIIRQDREPQGMLSLI